MKTVGIWAEHAFQVYSALPVIEKYLNKNRKVILFLSKKNELTSTDIYMHKNFSVVYIEQYVYKSANIFKLIFEVMLVPVDFSFVYEHDYVAKESLIKRVLRQIFFLKLPKNKVNKAYTYLCDTLFKGKRVNNFHKLDLMITFTKVYYSYLIPSKNDVKHINIMESWDHPIKFPYNLTPNYCLTWNKDLANDTKEFQELHKVRKIKPLKFQYIYELNEFTENELMNKLVGTDYFNELKYLKDKKVILYPTTSSSAGIMHLGEMELIREVCNSLMDENIILYIKPKPNAPVGDYDEFSSIKNVKVGIYSSSPKASDMLIPEYHIFRYLLLKNSDVVINAGTTFALEAALANRKVIQLSLNDKKYLGFDIFCRSYHLNKYVLSIKGVVDMNLVDLAKEVKRCNFNFSMELKKWITQWY